MVKYICCILRAFRASSVTVHNSTDDLYSVRLERVVLVYSTDGCIACV